MKHVYWKMFTVAQYEQEEAWLNSMSEAGLQLAEVQLFRYVFTEGMPNEYAYRLDLLNDRPGSAKGLAYIGFLRDMGIECVATLLNWAYLRKKQDGAPFELYSDRDSKLKHFERISSLCRLAIVLNTVAFFANMIACTLQAIDYAPAFSLVNASVACICLLLAVSVLLYSRPLRKQIYKLRRESLYTE